MEIDLHCHSTASDGLLMPEEVVRRAAEQGVRLLALTDHDSVGGLARAMDQALASGVALVPGVELSCSWSGVGIHVLGYDFDPDMPLLREHLETLRQSRWQRAEEIARRLAGKGMPGGMKAAVAGVLERGGNALQAPGRPHFADFLVQRGYVRDLPEAYSKWLGAGKVGDVKQFWPDMEDTLQVLKKAGGWISLAHPLLYNLTHSKRRRLVQAFVQGGGHALEVANSMQVAEQVGVLSILVRGFGLLASAGSDFHAPGKWNELGLYRRPPEDLPLLWRRFPQAKQLERSSD